MGSDYIVRPNWVWSNVNNCDDAEYCLGSGATSGDVQQIVLDDGESLSAEKIDAIFDFMAPVGQCYFVQKQFLGFEELFKVLVSSLDLREDGSFSLCNNLLVGSAKADAYITAIASAGDLVLDKAEHYIESTFGEGSNSYLRWKGLAKYLFDSDLGYALMCKLRNVTQHDKFMVNVVGVEDGAGRAYLVFNLEHDYETLGLGKGLKTELKEYKRERIKAGEQPRLSVYKAANAFRQNVALLYQAFIKTMDPFAREKACKLPAEVLYGRERYDCLVRMAGSMGGETEKREIMLLGNAESVSDMGVMDDWRMGVLLEERGALEIWNDGA